MMTCGATGDDVGETLMAMVRRVTTTAIMATLMGWEHGRRRHQAHPLPGRWGDDGGFAMMMAGGDLGIGFGGNSSRRQPPAAAAAKRQRRVRWEREGGHRQQPTNGGAQQCHPDNQQTEGRKERQMRWLKGEGRQTGNMTTNDQDGGNQHDNQRSSGGRRCGCDKEAQRCRLRCGGSQMGNTTTNQLREGGGDGRHWTLNGRGWTA